MGQQGNKPGTGELGYFTTEQSGIMYVPPPNMGITASN